jgi:hypothetical protein
LKLVQIQSVALSARYFNGQNLRLSTLGHEFDSRTGHWLGLDQSDLRPKGVLDRRRINPFALRHACLGIS